MIISDETGIGIPETYRKLQTQEVEDDYVWVFDDDNELTDRTFIARLTEIEPYDVAFVEIQQGNRILPNGWPPTYTNVDMMNIVVSKAVWDRHRKDFGVCYEGDWHFIRSVMSKNYEIKRLGGVIGRTQRISKGKPE